MRSVRVVPKESQRRQYHNTPPPSGQLNDRGRIPERMEPHVVVCTCCMLTHLLLEADWGPRMSNLSTSNTLLHFNWCLILILCATQVQRIGGRDGGTLYAGRDDSIASKTLDANETTTSAQGCTPHPTSSAGTQKHDEMQSCNHPLTSSPGNGLAPDWRFLGHSRYTRPATVVESRRDLIFPGRMHGGGRDNSNKPRQNNSSTWTPVTR